MSVPRWSSFSRRASRSASSGCSSSASKIPRLTPAMIARAIAIASKLSSSGVGTVPAVSASRSGMVSGFVPTLMAAQA